MVYTSDLSIFIDKFINDNLSNQALDNLTAQVATYVRDSNIDRVFVKGLKSNGSGIGIYSNNYKKIRRKRGRQINYVDLTLTGQLRNSYGVVKTSNGYQVRFKTDYGDKISSYQIIRYGSGLFGVSPSDYKKIEEITQKFLDRK